MDRPENRWEASPFTAAPKWLLVWAGTVLVLLALTVEGAALGLVVEGVTALVIVVAALWPGTGRHHA